MSSYQLTVERGTQLARQVNSAQVSLPDSDEAAEMYLEAVQLLKSHGLERFDKLFL